MDFDAIVIFLKSHVVLIVSIFSVIILNGLRQALAHYFTVKGRYIFVQEFLSKFRAFTNDYRLKKFNVELYDWLNSHSGRVQMYLGNYGLATYRPPFESFIVHNHAIITQTLSEMRSNGNVHHSAISFADDSLMRYLGEMKDIINEMRKMTFNPLTWLRYGMQSIIVLPFSVLYWFGALNKDTVEKIRDNPLVKFTSVVTAGIGLMSTITSAITGKDQFWQALKAIFK